MRSEQINELVMALSKAQGQFKSAEKDGDNPFFKSSYATLNSVWDACREGLAENGLAVIQIMDGEDDLKLITILTHSSGQWIQSVCPLIPKIKPQDLGSFVTYMRRYSLAAIVGISPADDDGNAAQQAQHVSIAPKKPEFSAQQMIKFCEKHQLTRKVGEPVSYKREFLEQACARTKITETETIKSMMLNEQRFEDSFEKWLHEKLDTLKIEKQE